MPAKSPPRCWSTAAENSFMPNRAPLGSFIPSIGPLEPSAPLPVHSPFLLLDNTAQPPTRSAPSIYSLQTDGIHAFLIDSQTGALSEIPGSPFTDATGAQGVLTISGTPIQALSGAVAALFPASENFDSTTVGQSSNSRLGTLTDTGDQALSVNALTLTGPNAAEFAATPTCP